MKLWIVIYVSNIIGGSIGPLPYDINECNKRIIDYNKVIEEKGNNQHIHFVCELHDERPKINENIK